MYLLQQHFYTVLPPKSSVFSELNANDEGFPAVVVERAKKRARA
jgi:hypothetical protein